MFLKCFNNDKLFVAADKYYFVNILSYGHFHINIFSFVFFVVLQNWLKHGSHIAIWILTCSGDFNQKGVALTN